MNSTRMIAVMTSVAFIVATGANLVGAALTPALSGADYMAQFAAHGTQVAAGAILYLIAAFASVGIAVLMYPILKERNGVLSLGSVVFRALEAAFYLVGVVCLLALRSLSQQILTSDAVDTLSRLAVGGALVSVHDHAGLVAVFAFCLGAAMYYAVLYQSRIIPRWLSGAGLVAVALMMTACMLSLLSGRPITSYIPLAAPIGLQEMVLAVWLIAKGFSPAAVVGIAADS